MGRTKSNQKVSLRDNQPIPYIDCYPPEYWYNRYEWVWFYRSLSVILLKDQTNF